ncbi:MAG: right-handed parallel beta-helix repeat-containing protein [Rhodocyclaceae bacterium]
MTARRTKLGADRTAPSILLALLLASSLSVAHAATLRVGPGEAITRIAEAARLAKDGDTVEILSGEYRGDVAVWQQKQLVIRGIGPRPVLIADGKSAEGKAIWVIRNGDILIENIEFRGSRVPSGNGAGIRFEGGRLTVRNCAFIDNQMGILTSNDSTAELAIENSRFAEAPHQMHSLPHLLYVGRIAKVTITGSRFEKGYRGHLVKSRARQSILRDNHIVDSPDGEASYEIDLPNGGIAHIIGNTVGQSAKTQNPVLISYGAEANVWPDNALVLKGNTLISDLLPGGWFLRIHEDKFPSPPRLDIGNNVTKGIGLFSPNILQHSSHQR